MINLNEMSKFKKEEPINEPQKKTFVSKQVEEFSSFMGGYAIFTIILNWVIGMLTPCIVLYIMWRLVVRHMFNM